jgi:hypothetical protein
MKIGGKVQDAPPNAAAALKEEAFRETIGLLASAPKWTAQALGESKFGGKSVEGLLVTDPATNMHVRIFVDPKTSLLAGKVYTGSLMGPPSEIEEVYLDFKDVDGVKFPSHSVLSQNGAKRAELKVEEIAVNASIPDTAFSKPQ